MQFLGELRELDWDRAIQVADGTAHAEIRGYSPTLRAAAETGRTQRPEEWRLAREAASVLARGKLGSSAVTEQVVELVADVAGVIAIKDLLPDRDVELLLLPWTWRGGAAARVPAAIVPAAIPNAQVKASRLGRSLGAQVAVPGLVAVLGLIAVIGAFGLLNPPKPAPTSVGGTASPTLPLAGASSPVATGAQVSSVPPSVGSGTAATPTPPPSVPASSVPSPNATAAPPPATPAPTPRPARKCTVVSLHDLQTYQAQAAWKDAGFTGTVFFSPDPPPSYTIQWQSLTPGTKASCKHDINVSNRAP
jgi:hypothetical protein